MISSSRRGIPVSIFEQSLYVGAMDAELLWVAPLLLLPGVGLLVMSTAARFGQIHEEIERGRVTDSHEGAEK
ncbi:MAG: hypothetical protein WBN14_01035 [Polyangiales bacterium]